jgi:pSer/pThr/pTyr-binding forkhead associated (FHA) protein
MLIDILRYVATRDVGTPTLKKGLPSGARRVQFTHDLILTVQSSDTKFVFDADQVEELVIGRKNPETGETPDVDLFDVGALEKGVSRKHASIIRKDGSLQIMDNGTPNGTFLNGQMLVPRQPRVLRDGDDIRLGHLVLHIKFHKFQPE